MKFRHIFLIFLLSPLLFPAISFGYDGGGGPPVFQRGEGDKGPPDCQNPPCCESADECCDKGAPAWSVNMVNMNLYVSDTPIWYNSAVGPSVSARLSYNSQAEISGHELFGNKWIFKYNAFLQDDNGTITVTMPSGREIVYPSDGTGGYNQPYKVNTPLVKVAENHFELRFLSGKVYVFNHHSAVRQKTYLTEIRNNRGQGITLEYGANDNLATITDYQNRATMLLYNAQNLVRRIEGPFGRFAAFEYDTDRNLTKITDMGGYATELEYDDSFLAALINDAGRTEFYTEPADNAGTTQDYNYPAPGADMMQSYRITVTLPNGEKEEYYYRGNGGTSWYVAPEYYVEYQSPTYNNFTSAAKTTYQFTGTSRGVREEIQSISYPNPFSKKIFTIDHVTGRIMSQADAAGNITRYTYNDNGNVETITAPNEEVTTYIYDENGVDKKEIQTGLGTIENDYNDYHRITSTKDYYDHETLYEYNQYGQVTKITDPLNIETVYTYNGANQLARISMAGQVVSEMTYDPIGRLKTSTDATGLTTTYNYDNLDHITTITYSDGKTTTMDYNSGAGPHLVTRTTDRSGRVIVNEYNAAKQLIRSVNPEGGVTKYVYDANGNLSRFIDPNSNATSFTYNGGNQLIKKTYADGRPVRFTYYNTSLLKKRTDARGIWTNYYYDELNNLVSKTYSDNTPDVTITYDNYGRPQTIQDGTGSYTFDYNDISQLLSIDGPLENDTITYDYDANGRRTDVGIQGGQQLQYDYDDINRLTKVEVNGAEYTYAYPNAKTPLIQSLTRPNGSVTSYQYDGLNRLREVANRNSAAEIINQYIYMYNEQDLRGSEEIINAPLPTGFEEGMKTFQYNVVNQLLSSASPDKFFTYDTDGNMTTGYTPEGYSFTAKYDAEERLSEIEYRDSASVIHKSVYTYRWDSFIGRIQKYENNTLVSTTHIIRDRSLALQDRDGNNNVLREYAWGANMGGGIGGLLNLRQNGIDYSYLYDGKGNVTTVLDNSQAIVASYNYNAFGKLMNKSGTLEQPFQFSTKRYDEGIGLNYYGYRFYSPAIERWMNRDPLGEDGGMNLYGFVRNDPVNWVDPWGLDALTQYLFGTDGIGPLPGSSERAEAYQEWVNANQTDYSVFTGPLQKSASFLAGALVTAETGSPQAGIWAAWVTDSAISILLDAPVSAPPHPGNVGIEWFNPSSLNNNEACAE